MIVVGVDGSPASIEALRWAAGQAVLTGDDLTAVAAWEWPTTLGWAPPYPEGYDPASDAQKALAQAVGKVQGDFAELKIDTRVLEGRPAPVLLGVAKDADLLVVGSRGHGEFTGMLIGSVSEHCVAHARCPVVVVRGLRDHSTS